LRRLVAIACAAATAVTLAITVPTAATAAPARPSTVGDPSAVDKVVDWQACSDPTLQSFGAVCGTVTVPVDYSKPHGKKIQLAVSMVRHTVPDSQYQGVMLVNPGGPGGSGLIYSILQTFVPPPPGGTVGGGAYYDWIGFDPRGVGASAGISCQPYYSHGDRPPYDPANGTLAVWLKRSAGYAKSCAQKNDADLLNNMKTTDSAKDMESIRKALGQKVINYYGFSYGTYLGQVYTTLFPTHMRRMVLDANVDPRNVWYVANLNQDVAFERNIKIWFAWVAKYDSVYHLGKTETAVEALWYKTRDQLDQHAAGGIVGGDEWTDIFLYAGYYQSTWLDLGDTFVAWVKHHNQAKLIAEFRSSDGPGDDNGFAVYNAVQCTDVQWPQKWSTWQKDNDRVNKIAPFETWGNAWFNAPCLYWPAKAGTPVTVNGKGVAPALLVDETLDAATPYEGSLEVRKLYPNAVLLAEPGGTTHAGTLFGNACVDGTIGAYLADGTLPTRKPGNRADAFCAPLPVPVPTAAATATAAAAKAGSSSRAAVLARLQLATAPR
jgi:pimeloyl-ACP methyl ester carboxylesterase